MPRYALLIAYDGTDFAGWWRQPEQRTVAGEFDEALTRIGEQGAEPVGSSRTDAGVHARGQFAHVDLRRNWEPARLALALGRHLPPDASCLAAAQVDDDWHAVHGVRRKTYRYQLDTGLAADPMLARTTWRVAGVNTALLLRAATAVPGQRDWAAFVRRGEYRSDTTSRALSCRWRRRNGVLACDLSADGFIYRLVRSLVGGMVSVARGSSPIVDWQAALAGTVNGAARQQAPAHGLHLLRIVHRQPPRWVVPGS
ncbi:MAG: tRNA pseudouridine synthase A [Planctomycetota bacterium]